MPSSHYEKTSMGLSCRRQNKKLVILTTKNGLHCIRDNCMNTASSFACDAQISIVAELTLTTLSFVVESGVFR